MGSAEIQGDLWGARAREWADLQEGSFRPLYEAVFAAAKTGKGTRVLDVGCGAGLACSIAQSHAAQVSGIDASSALVDIAKQRCPGADIRVGELEALPIADDSFDVTTGFNAFQYASDAVHALSEARRVTRPSGSVVIAVWGAADKCDLAPCLAAIGKLLPPPPPGATGRSPCRHPARWKLSPRRRDSNP
jgi:ubiquinone/menaquinone biosynthesis C-methylase UbiE